MADLQELFKQMTITLREAIVDAEKFDIKEFDTAGISARGNLRKLKILASETSELIQKIRKDNKKRRKELLNSVEKQKGETD